MYDDSLLNNQPTTWALVPIKDFAAAKSRLTPVLDIQQCAQLGACMAADVIAALHASSRIDEVACLGSAGPVRQFAAKHECLFIEESPGTGWLAALDAAAQQIAEAGAGTLLIVPGDLPTISAGDIDALLAEHAGGLTLCPARRDGGTNALAISPPDAIDFRFGDDSCARHIEAARDRGLDWRVSVSAAFDNDIDVPADLAWLLEMNPAGHTGQFLAASGLSPAQARPRAAQPR